MTFCDLCLSYSQTSMWVRTVLAMTTYSGLTELVKQTIESAMDDGTKGTLANIRFDPDQQMRVFKQVHSAERLLAAVGTCEAEMKRWIIEAADAGGDMELFGRARAALALKEKLERPRGGRYLPDGSGGFRPIS